LPRLASVMLVRLRLRRACHAPGHAPGPPPPRVRLSLCVLSQTRWMYDMGGPEAPADPPRTPVARADDAVWQRSPASTPLAHRPRRPRPSLRATAAGTAPPPAPARPDSPPREDRGGDLAVCDRAALGLVKFGNERGGHAPRHRQQFPKDVIAWREGSRAPGERVAVTAGLRKKGLDRVAGDRKDSAETRIASYQDALTVRTLRTVSAS
jgi:hypothetical protein